MVFSEESSNIADAQKHILETMHSLRNQGELVVSLDTIFPLASLSKPVTGTAALILAEHGQISLLQPLLDRLETDLISGKWDEKYGYYRSANTYEAGYRFLITE